MFFVNMHLAQSQLPGEFRFCIPSQEISAKALASVRCFIRSGEPGPFENDRANHNHQNRRAQDLSDAFAYLGNFNKPEWHMSVTMHPNIRISAKITPDSAVRPAFA
jgi:hypothetical protein